MALKEKIAKGKAISKYLIRSAGFALKRRFGETPRRIKTVVLDLDHTLIHETAAYASLQRMLGTRKAREEYARQIAEVKAGRKGFAGVMHWGHELQMQSGWRRQDWKTIGDQLYKSWLDPGIAQGLADAQKANQGLKIIITTGTSNIVGNRIAERLKRDFGLRVDHVIGSEQKFDDEGNVTGLVRFISSPQEGIPTKTKLDAIREKVPNFDTSTTLAISDADPTLLKQSGIGLLIPVSKGRDPASALSQKLKLYDLESKYGAIRRELIRELALRPQETMAEHKQEIRTELGRSNALNRRLIRERLDKLRSKRG